MNQLKSRIVFDVVFMHLSKAVFLFGLIGIFRLHVIYLIAYAKNVVNTFVFSLTLLQFNDPL